MRAPRPALRACSAAIFACEPHAPMVTTHSFGNANRFPSRRVRTRWSGRRHRAARMARVACLCQADDAHTVVTGVVRSLERFGAGDLGNRRPMGLAAILVLADNGRVLL